MRHESPLQLGSRAPETLAAFSDWCYQQSALWLVLHQGRKVNRQRGSWRRPQITGYVSALEKALRAAWDDTEHKIALLLAGESDGVQGLQVRAEDRVAAGGLRQVAGSGGGGASEAGAALDFHGIDRARADRGVDKGQLGAVLLALALWRQRQLALAGEVIPTVFGVGRAQVLKRVGRPDAPALAATAVLQEQMRTTYEADAQSLYAQILDGTARSSGVRRIVEEGATVGDAVLTLRYLFDSEAFRLTAWAEHLVWDSWLSGWRAGAVDATTAAVNAGEVPPQFQWVGPSDAKTCDPCLARFGAPIVARTLADLPAPSSICEGGRNCRHWFVVIV